MQPHAATYAYSDCLPELAAPGNASSSLLVSTMAGAEMTRSATEQPDVDMDSSLAVRAGPPWPTGSATEQPNPARDSSLAVPAGPTVSTGPCPTCGSFPKYCFAREILVSFPNGMWWTMPQELSDPILEQWTHGAQEVVFNWDWNDAASKRPGSWKPNGAETSISRYIINFDTMEQRNLDNNRMRKVKVVAILR